VEVRPFFISLLLISFVCSILLFAHCILLFALYHRFIVGLPWRPSIGRGDERDWVADLDVLLGARAARRARAAAESPPTLRRAATAPGGGKGGAAPVLSRSVSSRPPLPPGADDDVASSVRATVLRKFEEGVLSKEECDTILRKHFNFPMRDFEEGGEGGAGAPAGDAVVGGGECSVFTVIFYANHAHNLTRSP
jgi:hypothetical protein